MVELHDERDLVGVTTGDYPEHPERRGEGAALSRQRELGQILRVEVSRVLRETRRGRMLYPLVDRQDRKVPGPSEAAVVEHLLQVAQDGCRAGRFAPAPGRQNRDPAV